MQITVAGAESSDLVLINGVTVAQLNNSLGAPQNYLFSFPISTLRDGTNTLTLRSVLADGGDYDDFEFSNVAIVFSN